jgi:hypothetical protein
MTTSILGTTYLKDGTFIEAYKSRSKKIEIETKSSNMQGIEFDSKLDSRQDYDILEVLQGKEIQHWHKSTIDQRNQGGTLKNTLEARTLLGFEDSEEKGSQIP